MMKVRIPISQPSLSQVEMKYVVSALKSSWISSTGEFIPKFETKFAETFGARYAITTNNGTSALHLALLALGVGPGDEVIIPALTFVASSNSILYTGAKPVFVDVDPKTWMLDPQQIPNKITSRTRAIMPVHLYGYPAPMDQIRKLAKKFHLNIIEDAAEAHGAKYNGKYVGTLGDLGCFSFYGNKIITTGEGGMITTNSKKLRNKIMLLKNHGMSPQKKYWHSIVGYNYRMTNLQAAVGLAQLTKFHTFLKKREKIGTWYRQALRQVSCIILPPENNDITIGVNWLFTVLFKDGNGKTRTGLMRFLQTKGIDSRPVFYPLNQFPMYKTKEQFPVSAYISQRGITLPTYPDLSLRDISFITNMIAAYVNL